MKSAGWLCVVLVAWAAALSLSSHAAAQEAPKAVAHNAPNAAAQAAVPHAAAGEFGLARAQANSLDAEARDRGLAAIAAQQMRAGDSLAATRSIGQIDDPRQQAEAIAGVRGGGSLADFTQVMNLIQTTVAPETWDALGGPSTMAPYPGGIYVDAEGLVRDADVQRGGVSVEDIASLLRTTTTAGGENNDWRQPAAMRCVSLKRLAQEWIRLQASGIPPSAGVYNLGGLSRIEYVILNEAESDVILAGPVGGITMSDGWPRDRQSGAVVLQLPIVMAVMQSVMNRQPFGCTIDPSDEGLARALQVSAGIQQDTIPIGDAADAMAKALGRQDVTVFGTAADSPLAWLLVETDRHMKQLALGQQPMPKGVPNYLDVITEAIEQGPPDGQLLRLWFTSAGVSIRSDAKGEIFQLVGRPLRLASEDQRPDRDGRRHAANVDPRSRQFTAAFNKHFDEVAARYPIYSSLEGLYTMACVAELLRQNMAPDALQRVVGPFAEHSASTVPSLIAPRVVDSIAVMHTVKHRGRRHHIIVASGGVLVDSSQSLTGKTETYDTLAATRPSDTFRPAALDRWWWNVGN